MKIFIFCKCGKEVLKNKSFKPNGNKYCSAICRGKFHERPNGLVYTIKVKNKGWFSKKEVLKPSKKGYINMRVGKVMKRQHRFVMENYLGRALDLDEVVHHINGIKTDNRVENLEVMSKKVHDNIHKGRGVKALCVSL